jgi:hypothetical protein
VKNQEHMLLGAKMPCPQLGLPLFFGRILFVTQLFYAINEFSSSLANIKKKVIGSDAYHLFVELWGASRIKFSVLTFTHIHLPLAQI